MKAKLVELLSDSGPICQKMKGFEARDAQSQMLADIIDAYLENKTSLIEAGTGTGKSLAYLIPAIFWALEKNEPTVISTHTIALQEQLIKKDIPFLLEALGVKVKAVLVKGMSNYLCLRKLQDLSYEKRFFTEKEQMEIERIEEWGANTKTGSKSELPHLPTLETWEKVCAEAENCTHMKCPHYKECHFFQARREASDAQLLIANHHLLFADLSAREETNNYHDSCILPSYKRLILDEAHHTEDVATEHFAKRISRFSLFRLINRLLSEKNVGKLRTLHQKLFEAYPEAKRDQDITAIFLKLELDFPHARKRVMDLFDALFRAVLEFSGDEKIRLRSTEQQLPFWVTRVQPMAAAAIAEGRKWRQSILSLLDRVGDLPPLKEKCEALIIDIQGLVERLEKAFIVIHDFVFEQDVKDVVKWIEVTAAQNVHMITARLDIASVLATSLFEKIPTVVLCSATLATKREFHFIRSTLGIKDATEKLYDSPFDYEQKAHLLVPLDMPHPDHESFAERASEKIYDAVLASGGGTIVLFTSYGMLSEARRHLHERFKEHGLKLLVQGEESAHALLTRFRKNERMVLFGTDSFWEGVDVVGDALRCVVIVKLPFLVPSDPLFQAKSEKMTREGKSPFFDYSLPHAAMKFKQGFGRLIRSKTDRGCVVCLDSRIATKGYGKIFLGSLPPCLRTFDSSANISQSLQDFYRKPP